ncbi:MAG TPA: putative toxin-antitoxin system toxin component, PIN family [Polyangiaceae bacterium]|nr:putative toxin-antitoxin system toxin component, PIN family [Polyangiaceae bacterium]
MRVVLDTNVIVSGLIHERGTPAFVVDAVVKDESIVLLWDERMVEEYADVLARPRFGLDPANVGALLDRVRHLGERVAALRYDGAVADDDDRPFLEVALTGRADFLVTGNRKHFPAGHDVPQWLRIVSPREFMVVLFVRSIVRAIFPWV